MSNTEKTPDSVAAIPTIATASRRIREGSLNCADLLEQVIARIAATEPIVHAYAYLDLEGARHTAAAADEEIRRTGPRTPLHGIPMGIKDLIEVRGMPTTAGSMLFANHQSRQDAAIVARLRTAGAIFIGKQHTHQFGVGVDFPPSRTPWDPQRYAGGSTIGGAVSLAARSCLAAIGTDGGGSIRKPAAINGLVGLKPTLDVISPQGIFPGSASVDHIGWLTQDVNDAALIWDALTGERTFVGDGRPLQLRIGCIRSFFDGLDSSIERCVRQALRSLEAAGATVTWIDLPAAKTAAAIHGSLVGYELFQRHRSWLDEHPDLYDPRTRHCLLRGADISLEEVEQARADRAALLTAFEDVFSASSIDVLCSPTVAIPSEPISGMDAEKTLPSYIRLTVPYNLTGQPAISVPIGIQSNGMPVGLQIAAPLHQEGRVLRAAAQVEKLGLWNNPVPPALVSLPLAVETAE